MKKAIHAILSFLVFLLTAPSSGWSYLGCKYSDWESFFILNESVHDVCCYPSNLEPPFKENRVNIGVSGWTTDPRIRSQEEMLESLFNKTGCAAKLMPPRPIAG